MAAQTHVQTLGRYLMRLLAAYDVEFVFGIPGVHTIELYRGLPESGVRHITPRHEQGAGFMADGYARTTGKPGVCLVITGPGLSNIATAMLQAKADSIPMLVISGVNRLGDLDSGRGYLHEMPDQRAFAKQISAFSRTILKPKELPEAVARAFAIFEGARPGPVHIETPIDMMNASVDWPDPTRPPRVAPPTVGADGIARMARACGEASAPVILLGGGAKEAGAEALRLAEHLDAPLVTTMNARDAITFGHPLAVQASPSRAAVRDLINGSDLTLAFGTELGPTDFDVYDSDRKIRPRRMFRVDIDVQQLMRSAIPAAALVGDGGAAIRDLLAALPDSPRQGGGAGRAKQARDAALAELPEHYHRHIDLLEAIRDIAPTAILVGDSTQLVYAGNEFFDPGDRGGWINSSGGFGTLGYGIPAALGAKLGAPDRPVICLIGDGGAQFTLGELGAIADHGAPVIIVVWNNDGYGEIRDYMINAQVRPNGVDLAPPDFTAIARAYKLRDVLLEKADALPTAIAEAIALRESTLIEVRGV